MPNQKVSSTVIRNPDVNSVGLIVQGAENQVNNLQEWRNHGGFMQAAMSVSGQFRVQQVLNVNSFNNSQIQMADAGTLVTTGIAGNAALRVRNTNASATGNLQEWQDSNGTIVSRVTSGGSIVSTQGFAVLGGAAISGSTAALFQVSNASRIPVTIQGAASQTANLQEWQNSAGTILGRVDASGAFTAVQYSTSNNLGRIGEASSGGFLRLARMTAQASSPGNNVGTLYLRDGTDAGTLKLVVRAGAAGAETTILDNIPQ